MLLEERDKLYRKDEELKTAKIGSVEKREKKRLLQEEAATCTKIVERVERDIRHAVKQHGIFEYIAERDEYAAREYPSKGAEITVIDIMETQKGPY